MRRQSQGGDPDSESGVPGGPREAEPRFRIGIPTPFVNWPCLYIQHRCPALTDSRQVPISLSTKGKLSLLNNGGVISPVKARTFRINLLQIEASWFTIGTDCSVNDSKRQAASRSS